MGRQGTDALTQVTQPDRAPDHFFCIGAVTKRVVIALGGSRTFAAMHAAARFPRHRGALAGAADAGPRATSLGPLHRADIAEMIGHWSHPWPPK